MIGFLIAAIKIIILLGFLILIHEAGHFTVAKLCKVKVNEFSIGFGPTIWKKQGKETKYSLRLIPLGGFVSMEGEDERSEEKNSFSKASIPKRMAIVVAGATVNILFAMIVYFTLISTSGTFISNEINTTLDGYAAKEAGLQAGDKIVEIDGNSIKSLYDMNEILEKSNGEELNIKIERNEENLEYKIKPTEVKSKVTGIYLDENGKIIALDKDSSAEKQGIKTNDELLKINGEEINGDRNKAIEILQQNKEQESVMLTVKRGNAEVTINLVPDTVSTYYLGVEMKYAPDTFANRCINGAIETKEFLISIVDNLKQLFTGRVGLDQMMGPVRNIRSSSKHKRYKRILRNDGINIIIIRSNKLTTNTSTRWRKIAYLINRSN